MSRKKIPADEKVKAVELYLSGKASQLDLADRYGVHKASVQQWIRNYTSMGSEAFTKRGWSGYSSELKEQAVRDHLEKQIPLNEICKKYKIRSKKSILDWIKKYNSHEVFKSSNTGAKYIMTNGKKTTFEERLEIVEYCISHNHNYNETAAHFGISYQQARSYTLKYEKDGTPGLEDKRGKRKPEDEKTEMDRLRAENRLLKAEKEHAEMEVAFLKKLEEIERRWS